MGLKPARLGPLHLLADAEDARGVHRILRERALFEQLAQRVLIKGVLDDFGEASTDFRLIAVTDCVDQQFPKRAAFELHLAEHVEDLATERIARLSELLQQPAVDVALARLLSHEVPQMASFRLADAMDAAETLLEPIRIPGQIVIDHQVGALKVDALAGRIGRQQHPHFGIVPEGFLRLHALLAAQAAVDDDDGGIAAEQRADTRLQVVERVAVLGKHHELLAGRGRRLGRRGDASVVRRGVFRETIGDRGGSEDFAEQGREFAPFLVVAAATDGKREAFEALERFDLDPQFVDGASGGRLVEDLFFGRFQFRVRCIVEVLDVFLVEQRGLGVEDARDLAAALQDFQLSEPAFESFAAAAQRLINRLGR
jgi:hypothetical protein